MIMLAMDAMMTYPGLILCASLLVLPFLSARWKSSFALAIVLVNSLLTSLIAICGFGRSEDFALNAGWILGEVTVRIDPLASWFILIINLTCITAAWYGRHYMKAYLDQRHNLALHWVLFLLFHYSMLLVVTIQNGIAFLVVWEIMSLSSFLLVMFEHTRMTTLRSGINYLVQMHIGAGFLMTAVIWMSAKTGSADFSSLETLFAREDGVWLFALFAIGFGVKAGFIPLHTWLPHAHPAAPSHVSGVMSGVMVAMGIYGILRISSFLTTNMLAIGVIIFLVSLMTACYGILNAAVQRDFKRVLAFSTIENVGIIGMGIGIGMLGKYTGNSTLLSLGFAGALLHVLNHSLYKPMLFYAAGNIYQLTRTRNMEQLGGLVRKLPYTAFFFLCGAIAIAGLPPFNGFISKFMLFSGMIEGFRAKEFGIGIIMITGVTGLALVGGMSILAFTRVFSIVFLGLSRNESRYQPPEYINSGHTPLMILLLLMLFLAMAPAVMLGPLQEVIRSLAPSMDESLWIARLPDVLSSLGLCSLVLLIICGALYGLRRLMTVGNTDAVGPTWGCGYPATSSRMQYTGKSFSRSLAKLLNFVTGEEQKYTEIPSGVVFPTVRSYQSRYVDFFEKRFIDRILNAIAGVINRVTFIHNGRVQYYILYGLIFLLLLFASMCTNINQS